MWIDWKQKAITLAKAVIEYEKSSDIEDRIEFTRLAREIGKMVEHEDRVQRKFLQYWKCRDSKKAKLLYDEYLEMARDWSD